MLGQVDSALCCLAETCLVSSTWHYRHVLRLGQVRSTWHYISKQTLVLLGQVHSALCWLSVTCLVSSTQHSRHVLRFCQVRSTQHCFLANHVLGQVHLALSFLTDAYQFQISVSECYKLEYLYRLLQMSALFLHTKWFNQCKRILNNSK